MQIHISQTTKDHLEHEPYIIEERGKIFVKVYITLHSHQSLLSIEWIPNGYRVRGFQTVYAKGFPRFLFTVQLLNKMYLWIYKTKIIIMIKGKGYMKTYWLKGKKDLSFKTPAELRYSSEQKDSEDRSSNRWVMDFDTRIEQIHCNNN